MKDCPYYDDDKECIKDLKRDTNYCEISLG